jgi:alkanesulfonate monooxygenase SsuD/methylene tetrahydromethanopterin reductase-like flavin-dependent oxidoreductase (luciferase family)
VAAATSQVKVGTWILSALHRNPAITAKVVETLDEISGGRFVFGLGSGHAGKQGHAFGLPEDHVIGRFEEALEIIAPPAGGPGRLRGHVPRSSRPRAATARPTPRPHPNHDRRQGSEDASPGRPPCRHLELVRRGAQRPGGIRAAAAALEAACLEIGRDPASIGRSAGIFVEPTDITGAAEAMAIPVRGSAEEMADGLRAFRAGGFTQIEILLWPRTLAALEAMAPVLELLDAD